MSDAAGARKLDAIVVRAEADGAGLLISYAPVRGGPPEIEDRIALGPADDVGAVQGIGRLLRVLRAGRVRAPADPYALADDPESAAALVRQCCGARVTLHVARRFERVLTLWTEDGVSRIDRVVDVVENADALEVRRRGGDRLLCISRQSVIRFALETREHPEVVSVEVSTKASLR